MTLLLLQAAVTLTLVGLIWTIQVVHYPLMDGVGADAFADYHRRHGRSISWLIVPLMPAELGMAAWIAWSPPSSVPAVWAYAGVVLAAALWVATALLSVPAHNRLAAGFDAGAHRQLVRTNWLRTLLWTARGGLALAMVARHAAS